MPKHALSSKEKVVLLLSVYSFDANEIMDSCNRANTSIYTYKEMMMIIVLQKMPGILIMLLLVTTISYQLLLFNVSVTSCSLLYFVA